MKTPACPCLYVITDDGLRHFVFRRVGKYDKALEALQMIASQMVNDKLSMDA